MWNPHAQHPSSTPQNAASSLLDAKLHEIGGVPLSSFIPPPASAAPSGINMPPSIAMTEGQHGQPSLPPYSEAGSDSMSSTRDLSDGINPISVINTFQQKIKEGNPPKYDFSMATPNGGFFATLEVFGSKFQTTVMRAKKQEAKEEVARMAVDHYHAVMPEAIDAIKRELVKAANQAAKKVQSSFARRKYRDPDSEEDIPKSLAWRNKHAEPNQPLKRPSVLLLEFCQFHHMSRPVYTQDIDAAQRCMCSVQIEGQTFSPDSHFWSKNDARDHIAQKALIEIYNAKLEEEASAIGHAIMESERDLGILFRDLGGDNIKYSMPTSTDNVYESTTHSVPNIPTNNDPQLNSDTAHPALNPVQMNHPPVTGANQTYGNSDVAFFQTVTANQLGPPPRSGLVEKTPLINAMNSNNQLNPQFNKDNLGIFQMMIPTHAPQGNHYYQYAAPPYPPPYMHPAAYNVVPISTPLPPPDYKRYVSRLYELAQARKWEAPVYNFKNVLGGFKGEVTICQKTFYGNKTFARKADAKEDVSELAWKHYTRSTT